MVRVNPAWLRQMLDRRASTGKLDVTISLNAAVQALITALSNERKL
jgi:hypothetical protein